VLFFVRLDQVRVSLATGSAYSFFSSVTVEQVFNDFGESSRGTLVEVVWRFLRFRSKFVGVLDNFGVIYLATSELVLKQFH